MSTVTEILAKYPGLPIDLRAQLSAELAGMERDAGRSPATLAALQRIVRPRDHGCDARYCDCNTPESLQIYIDGLKETAQNAIDAAMTKGK